MYIYIYIFKKVLLQYVVRAASIIDLHKIDSPKCST